MNNIIQSDLYRIRKGAAMRNTLLGLLAFIILLATLFSSFRTDGVQVTDNLPQNGADFTGGLPALGILTMMALVIAVAVMGADFGAGTFRNTLSYETDRKKVYLGKLAVSLILMVVLMAANVLFGAVVGSIFFGFAGFSGEFVASLMIVLALQLPVYMALLSLAQCVLAFTKKSGATIAVYLLFVSFFPSVVQVLYMLLPDARWILRLDIISAVTLAAQYQTASAADIIVPLIVSACVLAGTAALGMARYCKADMH